MDDIVLPRFLRGSQTLDKINEARGAKSAFPVLLRSTRNGHSNSQLPRITEPVRDFYVLLITLNGGEHYWDLRLGLVYRGPEDAEKFRKAFADRGLFVRVSRPLRTRLLIDEWVVLWSSVTTPPNPTITRLKELPGALAWTEALEAFIIHGAAQ